MPHGFWRRGKQPFHRYLFATGAGAQNKIYTEPTVQLMSEALKDVKNYKKVVEELLKNHEKNKVGN